MQQATSRFMSTATLLTACRGNESGSNGTITCGSPDPGGAVSVGAIAGLDSIVVDGVECPGTPAPAWL